MSPKVSDGDDDDGEGGAGDLVPMQGCPPQTPDSGGGVAWPTFHQLISQAAHRKEPARV